MVFLQIICYSGKSLKYIDSVSMLKLEERGQTYKNIRPRIWPKSIYPRKMCELPWNFSKSWLTSLKVTKKMQKKVVPNKRIITMIHIFWQKIGSILDIFYPRHFIPSLMPLFLNLPQNFPNLFHDIPNHPIIPNIATSQNAAQSKSHWLLRCHFVLTKKVF